MIKLPIISGLALIIGLAACSSEISSEREPIISEPVELSFHMVRKESNNEAAMRLALEGKVPPGTTFYKEKDGVGLIVEKRTRVTQDCLEMVSSSENPMGEGYILNFKLDEVCTKFFGEVTSKSIGKRFAVVLNREIISAPRINGAITAGLGFIEGDFSKYEVDKIVQDLLPYTKLNKMKNSKR